MGELSDLNWTHARRQLGYGIILMLATAVLAFWAHLYVAYSPGDTGMQPTPENRAHIWAIPITLAIASICALTSSFRIYGGARPTPLARYSALICLGLGTLLNYSLATAVRLAGVSQ